MMEGMEWLASLGVGGVLAGGMFLFYRRDFLRERSNSKENKEMRIQREKVFIALVEGNAKSNAELTASIHELKEVLKIKLP